MDKETNERTNERTDRDALFVRPNGCRTGTADSTTSESGQFDSGMIFLFVVQPPQPWLHLHCTAWQCLFSAICRLSQSHLKLFFTLSAWSDIWT